MQLDEIGKAEAEKYSKMWEHDQYRRHSPGERILDAARVELGNRGMAALDSLADFGCGTGRAALGFMEHRLAVTGIDITASALDRVPASRIQFVLACLWDLPDGLGPFDWGYCTDVMEHIPPEKVDAVLASISRLVSKACVFQMSCRPDGCGALIGETLHLTVRTPGWWRSKLGMYFDNVEVMGDGGGNECTFIADGRSEVRSAA